MTAFHARQKRVLGKVELLLDLLISQARGIERDRKAALRSTQRARLGRISAEFESPRLKRARRVK